MSFYFKNTFTFLPKKSSIKKCTFAMTREKERLQKLFQMIIVYNAALVHQKVTFKNFNPTHSHFPMQNLILA